MYQSRASVSSHESASSVKPTTNRRAKRRRQRQTIEPATGNPIRQTLHIHMSTFCPVNYPVLEIATARSLQTELPVPIALVRSSCQMTRIVRLGTFHSIKMSCRPRIILQSVRPQTKMLFQTLLPPAITPARRPPSDDDAVPPHPSLLSSARESDSSSSSRPTPVVAPADHPVADPDLQSSSAEFVPLYEDYPSVDLDAS